MMIYLSDTLYDRSYITGHFIGIKAGSSANVYIYIYICVCVCVCEGVCEGVSKSFRTGRLELELKWYSSLPLGAVVSLFCESV
jgi:hypothetical protein